MSHTKYPKLRWPLDIKLESYEGQKILLIRCPTGISEEPLLLVPAVGPLIACFDGKTSVPEITAKFASYGIKDEVVLELIALLDKHLYLEGPTFSAAQRKILESFKNESSRKAFMAGLSYAADGAALRSELAQYLQHKVGADSLSPKGPMLGFVAPHIDYRRGHVCYGKSYNQLALEDHDLYILIGTSHQYSDLMFHLTKKDFESPLGTLPCDTAFVEELAKRYGYERSFADELLHRREHSLELQVPFIKYLKTNPKIVPILVGSFSEMLGVEKAPREFDQYESFAASLAECVGQRRAQGQRVLVVAGVDMAHVGRFFGDPGSLSDAFMQQIEVRDRIYLDTLLKQDKERLFAHIAQDNDARRVCGFPTLYTVLDVFERLGLKYRGQLYDYRQAVNLQNDCAVTFAGLGMYEQMA